MEHSINIDKKNKILRIGNTPLYGIILIFVIVLAVLQDYIYSKLQDTGFYLSESLLYNMFWMFFIPFTVFINRLISIINPKNKWTRLPYNLIVGVAFSLLHILAFASLFVLISYLVFTPSHRFSNIFYGALSNQFYITLLWYVICPIVYILKRKPANLTKRYPEKVKLKIGPKIITIPMSSIQLISTDKPYSIVYGNDQKFLDNKSLKEFETELDPTIFLRVHRSAIINSTYVKELKSRSNGDYDAKLENGQMIRLSRHYRTNWDQLLQ